MLRWHNCETHYYSIDNILVTQEKVPCLFKKNIPQIDGFSLVSDNGEVKKDTLVEIPLWLAEELAFEEYSVIRVEVPKIYKDVFRDVLNADASVVDLYKMSKFFYSFGKLISHIESNSSTQLTSLLIQTFKERFRQLLDWVQNLSADEIITEKLDFLEQRLLVDGRSTQNQLLSWLSNGLGSMQPADVVLKHKKRKLAALETF